MRLIEETIAPFGFCIKPEHRGNSLKSLSIDHLRKRFAEHDLLILRDFDFSEDKNTFISFCKQWGRISIWPFGEILELQVHKQPEDHIFDHSFVPMHWDGMYREEVPEIQIFHCLEAPAQECGGRTTFSNTRKVIENATAEQLEAWSQVGCTYERTMEFYSSKTRAPVLTKHPYLDFNIIRFCEGVSAEDKSFVNHPNIDYEGIERNDIDSFKKGIGSALHCKTAKYAHTWKQGDVVISNNFVLLHGREAFTKDTPRHLRRVHISAETPYANPFLETYK